MWYKINVEQSSCNNYFDLLFLARNSLFCTLIWLQKGELICWFIGNRKIDELLHVVPAAVVHLMVK